MGVNFTFNHRSGTAREKQFRQQTGAGLSSRNGSETGVGVVFTGMGQDCGPGLGREFSDENPLLCHPVVGL